MESPVRQGGGNTVRGHKEAVYAARSNKSAEELQLKRL